MLKACSWQKEQEESFFLPGTSIERKGLAVKKWQERFLRGSKTSGDTWGNAQFPRTTKARVSHITSSFPEQEEDTRNAETIPALTSR